MHPDSRAHHAGPSRNLRSGRKREANVAGRRRAERLAELGSAAVVPAGPVKACSRGTWKVVYQAGKEGILPGGAVRVAPPWNGMDHWELGQVSATTDSSDAALEVSTENAENPSTHWREFPAVTVKVLGAGLRPGEKIEITLGDPGGYFSGFRRLAKAQETAARDQEFRVYVDVHGSAHRPREVAMEGAFRPVIPAPSVDVVAGEPTRIQVALRAPPSDGAPAALVASVVDAGGNPVDGYTGSVSFQSEGPIDDLPTQIRFRRSDKGAVKRQLAGVGTDAVRVVAYDADRQLFGASQRLDVGFTAPYHTYFGDLHVMTGYYSPHLLGTTESAYEFARDCMGFDFGAVTNAGEPKGHDARAAEQYNPPGEFPTLLAYECGFSDGHKNIYFRGGGHACPPFAPRQHREFWQALRGKKVLVIPHTPNLTSESSPGSWGPSDFSHTNPRYERLIEICQNRGASETEEPEWPTLFGGYGASVQSLLAKGLRYGFVGGTDTHRGRPGSYLCPMVGLDSHEVKLAGITGVLTESLTREALWDALYDRRCFATTGERLQLSVTCGKRWMGAEIRVRRNSQLWQRREFRIRVLAPSPLQCVELLRNNEIIATTRTSTCRLETTLTDESPLRQAAAFPAAFPAGRRRCACYYVRARLQNRQTAWASPFWFDPV